MWNKPKWANTERLTNEHFAVVMKSIKYRSLETIIGNRTCDGGGLIPD